MFQGNLSLANFNRSNQLGLVSFLMNQLHPEILPAETQFVSSQRIWLSFRQFQSCNFTDKTTSVIQLFEIYYLSVRNP